MSAMTSGPAASASAAPVVRIENLSLAFVGQDQVVEALRGISLRIDAGEIVGLVGESGSGKSVTAMNLLRLLPRDKMQDPAPTRR